LGMSRQGDAPDPMPDLTGFPPAEGAAARRAPSALAWIVFGLNAVRRRPRLFVVVFLAGLAATTAYFRLKTPVYRVEARVMAQRQQALPGIVRSAGGEDSPSRSAHDLVHRRDNLLNLINQVGLLSRLDAEAAGEGLHARLRRALASVTSAEAPVDDPLDRLVLWLDRELLVLTSEGSVTIRLDWPDPQEAFKLVEAATQNFLEARHVQEITTRDEAISLLQGRISTLRDELDRAVEASRRHQYRRSVELPVEPRPALPPPAPSEELVRLRSLMDAKERAIGDVEEFRRRRLADLQAQLDLQRGVYSSAHPTIKSLVQDISALSQESPQVAGLREELRRLREEHAARLAAEGARQLAPTATVPAAPRVLIPTGPPEETERVRQARYEYQQMVERTNAALLDLDNARAGFKYRYDVIWPAQVPRTPVSPEPAKVFGLGLLASFMLAVVAAAGSVLREGRIIMEWQLERSLDLKVLGRVARR